ncbi:peptidoglycan-binding domain-containing protein [Streptomyces roseoviridis]|uniref:Peptidoglycan-binding domain-containing protein n=1 Tax=Streptomyces roseoviridis TaxID=67361 RepID=A0ABV5QWG4_9ACTN
MAILKKTVRTAGVTLMAAGLAVGALAGSAEARPGLPNINRGDDPGTPTWCVQRAVNNWAERTGQGRPLGEDGIFGPGTEAWVKKFQRASGQTDDGVVGPRTGKSILDNAGYHRNYCYNYVPSPS